MQYLHLFALALSVLAFAGCGPAHPSDGALVDPTAGWRARYPDQHFIVARAEDTTAEAAADAARSRVAAQIASRIRASIEVESSETQGKGTEAVRRTVATVTGFDRAELIELPADLRRCHQTCTAVAVLDRAKAVEALRPEYDAARARFDGAARAAEAASEPADFTLHFNAAAQAHETAERLAQPLVVIGGEAPGRDAERARAAALRERADAVLTRTPVSLAMAGVDADLRPALSRALVRAFSELGLQAAPTAACADGLRFEPSAAVACGRSALGPRCRLTLTGTLAQCAGAPLTALDFSAAKLAAVHPRSDAEARAQLVSRVAQADLSAVLRANVQAVLPVRP